MLRIPTTILKTTAVFLSVNILTSVFAPGLSYALTAGPTAPESTSFEPVDTTDMVNLLTGDLAYNLPLLEVPGPEGGYSMALSYHAGIRPDEESSWVGLGWTLNAGAINRNVDGAPDDIKQNIIAQTRFTDAGGGKVQYVDVMGSKNGIGTVFTAHNFEGNGGMGSIALVEDYQEDQTFNSKDALRGRNDDYIRSKVRYWLGRAKLNQAGPYGPFGTPPPAMDTKHTMKVIPIPNIPGMYIDVKSNYWRWYKKQEGQLQNKGALYANQSMVLSETNSSDAYKLFSNSALLSNAKDADKFSYGLLPSTDFYSVSAQGLNGSIKPYNFENGTLFLQNDQASTTNDLGQQTQTTYRNCKDFNKKVNFRFEGDFSNALSIIPERILYNLNSTTGGVAYQHNLVVNSQGYNATTQQMAGSRHIDWYTINQVNNGYARNRGFMKYQNIDNQYISGGNQPFKKFSVSDTSTIGGFQITNEDGTTYHYGLPVYAYDELNIIRVKGNNYAKIESLNKNPYAYEWLLTSITGADYVDRNNNGLVDNSDWGYWTAFEYGKWTDKYMWRSPLSGYNIDIDGNSETCTSGYKEIYYLDAIKTRTHTALFCKSVKADGKGVKGNDGGVGVTVTNEITGACTGGNYRGNYYYVSIASMKLDKIYVLENNELNGFLNSNSISSANLSYLKANGTISNDSYSAQTICSANSALTNGYYVNYHMGDNVFDKNDLTASQLNDLKKRSLKIIEFNTSYSLCPGTSNSFNVADNYSYDIINGNPRTPQGKLTLNSVKICGRAGADLIPAYTFNYDVTTNLKTANFLISQLDNGTGMPNFISFGASAPPLAGGEVLKFKYDNLDYYASLSPIFSIYNGPPGAGAYSYYAVVQFLGTNIPTSGMLGISLVGTETRNPPYTGEMLDIWGRFKPDYRIGLADQNQNKKVTNASLSSQDLWNLREVQTPIGAKIKIEYEPDTYTKPKVFNNYSYNITSMTAVSGSATDVVLGGLVSDGSDLTTLFTIGSKCNFIALLQTAPTSATAYEQLLDYSTQNVEIVAVTSTTITVRAAGLTAKLSGCYSADFSEPSGGTCSNTFIGGKLKYYKTNTLAGGGLRVKNLTVEGSGLKKETNFTYESTPGVTSGVTAFEPFGFDQYSLSFPSSLSGVSETERVKKKAVGTDAYLKILYREFSDVLKLSRFLPAPGVMYEFVTVTQKSAGVEHPLKTRYQFQVFDNDMISIAQNPAFDEDAGDATKHRLNYVNTIKDNTGRIGNLKSIMTYDKDGRVINRKIKKYLHDNTTQTGFESLLATNYNNQGKVSQSFNDYKVVSVTEPAQNFYSYAVTNLVEEYPSVLQKEEYHDLLKGKKTEMQYIAYDFYSGAPTKQFYKNSYGNNYLTELVPAYTKYPEMGLKVNNFSNRNMLSQPTASYVYKADANAAIQGTLSAQVETWNKAWSYRFVSPTSDLLYYTNAVPDDATTAQNEEIWRPHKNYVLNTPLLNPDGTVQNFTNFDWTLEGNGQAQQKYWQKNSEITLYDPYSNILETKDVNGIFASAKMGYTGSEILMTGTKARYTEIACTGAEDDALVMNSNVSFANFFGGEIRGRLIRSSSLAHTGTYSLPVSSSGLLLYYINNNSNAGRTEFDLTRKYRASVWVHKDYVAQAKLSFALINEVGNLTIASGYVQGSTSLEKAGNWYLLPMDIALPSSSAASVSLKIYVSSTGSNSVYFDDFRFHPLESDVTSYIYDPQTKLVTYILDNENFYTRFEYDALGRLTATYKETINGEKKISDYYTNYGRQR